MQEILKKKCSQMSFRKLTELNNQHLVDFVAKYAELCAPESIYVCDDSAGDVQYIREQALKNGEERKLNTKGHTIHFDSYFDQARDKGNTKYLITPEMKLGESINATEREQGLAEVHGYLKNSMVGKEAYVLIFCLGPRDSDFSIPCVQITDSSYVGHSEHILYRSAYEAFKKLNGSSQFFKYVHTAGILESGVSKEVDKRRIYIDLLGGVVYSTNTQYAGNTVGLKKLSLRLAIQKAANEDWLAEHMLLMGVGGPKGRISYFAGAFPSACGKTSTAMLKGEKIVGDDIAYLRLKQGKVQAANVECGIFGIIRDVNSEDDPYVWEVLNKPGEVIFSNVLIDEDNNPRWLGDTRPNPEKGINFSGKWSKAKQDAQGKPIPYAHKNARYTISLYSLNNLDPNLDHPAGVEVKGILYGGRDSDTWPSVQQSFDWTHGVITMGASLESETTAAALGKEGVRQFNPMSNLDFVSIPLGRYIDNHLKFGRGAEVAPAIFAVNYFLKDKQGEYLTAMQDKAVWMKWMELRVNNDVETIKTPTGYIPKYQDLKRLFKEVLDKQFSEQDYIEQFSLRVVENLAKLERITEIYKHKVSDAPEILFTVLEQQKQRLVQAQTKYGDFISPDKWQ
ncbi:MAG: phosphoenolpyruvate carboxykinase (GTP) [Candidatus Omnitrophica bacterium]|nr:phosphoenolpyruvate carboxykinase (GTP) [Candidatus Omnitrophota bacterium]